MVCPLSWSVHYNFAGDGSCHLMMDLACIKDSACTKDLTILSVAGRYKQAGTVRERVRP
jgi:hypothetical protein